MSGRPSLTVGELVEILPTGSELPPVRPDRSEAYVERIESGPFISPPLTGDAADIGNSPVLFVEAAAAVGKSMLVRHLAMETGCALWDLARYTLGDDFYTGLLSGAFDFGGAERFQAAVAEGRNALYLDSFDEAVLRTTEGGTEAALTGLARQMKGLGGPPKLVIAGRPDHIMLARSAMYEQDVDYAAIGIDFFEEVDALAFVQVVAEAVAAGEALKTPLMDATRQVFRLMGELLGLEEGEEWQDPVGRSFLGYAPVLVAVAKYFQGVDESRYWAVANELGGASGKESVWTVLREVSNRIITREQEKVGQLLGGWVAEGERGQLFDEDVQLAFLLRTPGTLAEYQVPPSVPDDREAELRKRLEGFANDHPFLVADRSRRESLADRFSHGVFRDFVFAKGCVDREEYRPAVLLACEEPGYKAGPLMGRFLLDSLGAWIAPDADDPERLPQVGPLWVPFLIESALVGRTAEDRVLVWIEEGEGETAQVRILFESEEREAVFEVVSLHKAPLSLVRDVSYLSVYAPGLTVALGLRTGGTVRLGPDVVIECGWLLVDAEEVVVRNEEQSGIERGSVWLMADQLQARGNPSLVVRPDADLGVQAEDLHHPWRQYEVRGLGPAESGDELRVMRLEVCNDLWGLLKWFKVGLKKAGRRFPARALDTAVAKGRSSADMLRYCLDAGLIEMEGGDYVLREDELGFRRFDVMNRELTEELVDFLDGYIREHDLL